MRLVAEREQARGFGINFHPVLAGVLVDPADEAVGKEARVTCFEIGDPLQDRRREIFCRRRVARETHATGRGHRLKFQVMPSGACRDFRRGADAFVDVGRGQNHTVRPTVKTLAFGYALAEVA